MKVEKGKLFEVQWDIIDGAQHIIIKVTSINEVKIGSMGRVQTSYVNVDGVVLYTKSEERFSLNKAININLPYSAKEVGPDRVNQLKDSVCKVKIGDIYKVNWTSMDGQQLVILEVNKVLSWDDDLRRGNFEVKILYSQGEKYVVGSLCEFELETRVSSAKKLTKQAYNEFLKENVYKIGAWVEFEAVGKKFVSKITDHWEPVSGKLYVELGISNALYTDTGRKEVDDCKVITEEEALKVITGLDYILTDYVLTKDDMLEFGLMMHEHGEVNHDITNWDIRQTMVKQALDEYIDENIAPMVDDSPKKPISELTGEDAIKIARACTNVDDWMVRINSPKCIQLCTANDFKKINFRKSRDKDLSMMYWDKISTGIVALSFTPIKATDKARELGYDV